MNGRALFLSGVLGLASLAAVARYARMSASSPAPPALTIDTAASPPAYGRRSASQSTSSVVVYVAGEVARPGVYRFAPGERAQAALRAAGGATGNADLVAVNLAEPLQDGEEIAVPARGSAQDRVVAARKPRRVATHGARRRKRRGRSAEKGKSVVKASVDLNTADEERLRTLPGVGASLAARIVAYRRLNGSFRTIDDVRDVGGITEGKFDRMEPYIIIP